MQWFLKRVNHFFKRKLFLFPSLFFALSFIISGGYLLSEGSSLVFQSEPLFSSELNIAESSPLGQSAGLVVPASCPSDLHDDPTYGQACQSGANACGQSNSGTYQCGGVCNATTPPNYTSGSASCATFAGQYGIPPTHTVGTASYQQYCDGSITYTGGCSAPVVCSEVPGTASCATFAGQYGIPATHTQGTANYTQNSCTGAITYTGGCSAPVVCSEVPGTASCATFAGSYGIPPTHTVGTAGYTQNSCTGAITYTGGCSAPSGGGAVCGNNVVEAGEQCDTGSSRGTCPRSCSNSCTNNNCSPAVCGNNVVESGEQCDTGSSRGACPATCSNSCTTNVCSAPPTCGNNVVESGEQCDTGSSRGACPATCSNSCTTNVCVAPAVCGNNVVESGEQCDTGSSRGACPATCSNSCTTNSCSGGGSDGVCGWANLGSFASTPPASGLCSAGTPSSVVGNGVNWTWSCMGSGAGNTPACWASVAGGGSGLCGNWAIDPGEQCDNGIVNGMCPSSCSNSCTNNSCGMFGAPPQCASTHYNCTEGWPTNSFNGATAWSWRCEKTGFADAVCMELKIGTGSITNATSCTIPVGSASCNGTVSWVTSNAVNPVLEVSGGSPAQIYSAMGNNQSITLSNGSHGVTLRDVATGIIYDSDTVAATCANGSTWNVVSSQCVPAPIVSLTVNGSTGPISTAPGNGLSIAWTVSGATSCTASGKWSGVKNASGGTENTTAGVPSGDYILTCVNGAGTTTVRQVTVNMVCTASTTAWGACGPPCASGNGTRSRTVTTAACVVTTETESCTTTTCRDLNWKEVGQ